MKAFREIRVIPVVVAAVFSLAVLKLAGLVIDGGYVFDYRSDVPARQARSSWAGDALGFPGARSTDFTDVTGSVSAKKAETKPEVKTPETTPAQPNAFSEASPVTVAPSERAVLERLQERRQELEARAREIDIRENLLKNAEKRVEQRAEEVKAGETRAGAAGDQKSEADAARFKALVTMYEGMKPKDAAKVFDRLDMAVLVEIASEVAPRKMSDILGLMSADAAERLTIELARRAGAGKQVANGDLPKIEGRPITPRN